MSLRDLALDEQRHEGPTCGVDLLRQRLTPDESAELGELTRDQSITAAALARACKRLGWDISAYTIQRHRRGDCSCQH